MTDEVRRQHHGPLAVVAINWVIFGVLSPLFLVVLGPIVLDLLASFMRSCAGRWVRDFRDDGVRRREEDW